jgi:hypothetical protein
LNKFLKLLTKLSLGPLLQIAISALLIPIIFQFLDVSAWSAYSIGQAFGALAGTFVGWGFQTVATTMSLRLPESQVAKLFADAFFGKFFLGLLAISATFPVAFALAPSHAQIFIGSAIVQIVPALSSSWYLLSRNRIWSALLSEALPKIVAVSVAIGALAIFQSEPLFLIALILGQLVSFFTNFQATGFNILSLASNTTFCDVLGFYRSFRHSVASSFLSLTYMVLPTIVLGILDSSHVASFSLTERLAKFVVLGFSGVLLFVQLWLTRGESSARLRRSRQATILVILSAAVIAVAFSTSCSWLAYIVSDGKVIVPLSDVYPFAAVIFLMVYTQYLASTVLFEIQGRRLVTYSALGGAIYFLVSCALQGAHAIKSGMAWNVLVSELVVAIIQTIGWILFRHVKPKRLEELTGGIAT